MSGQAQVDEKSFDKVAVPKWKMELMSEYFKDYKYEEGPSSEIHQKRKTISVDQEFVNTIYDQDFENYVDADRDHCLKSPPTLKKMAAAAAVHNDSGYEGFDSNKKAQQDLVSQEESSCSKPIPIRAEDEDDSEELRSIAPLLDKCSNSFSLVQFVEMTMVLVVIFSILSMIFMGDGHEAGARLGGKKAAIQFYYDSLNMNINQ